MAHNKNIKCTSIELADVCFQQAKSRFKSYANLELLHGDSGVLIELVLSKLNAPALFLLHGHYVSQILREVN